MKNKNLAIYIIISVILCFAALNNYTTDKYSAYFDETKLSSRYGTFSTEDSLYSGAFTYGPSCNLPAGKYNVTLEYSADGEGNYFDIYSNGKILSNDMDTTIDKNSNSKTVELDLGKDILNLEVRTYYSGDSNFAVKGVSFKSIGTVFNDAFFSAGVLALLLLMLGIYIFKDSKIKDLTAATPDFKMLFLLVACAIYISYPLFVNYVYEGHDIECHLARIEGVKEGLLSGQFPVRIHHLSVYNAGYASSNLYPELFLYIPALMRLCGVSLPFAYNAFLFMINIATVGVAYFSFKHLFKEKYIGLLGAVIYSTGIYRMANLYTRAALGEALAAVFIPLVIYGVYEIFFGDSRKWKYFVIACTGVLQSHVLNTLIVAVLSVVFGLIFIKKLFEKERLFSLLKACGLLILLNLWFLIPFIQFNLQDLRVSVLPMNTYGRGLQVISLFQGFPRSGELYYYASSGENRIYSMCTVGIPIMLGTLLCIYAFLFGKKETLCEAGVDNSSKIASVLLAFGVVCLYSTTKHFPWQYLQNLPYIGKLFQMLQFPWRMLIYATVFLAGCSAYAIFNLDKSHGSVRIAVLITALVISVFSGHYLSEYSYNDIYLKKGEVITYAIKDLGEYLPSRFTEADVYDLQYRVENNIGAVVSDDAITIESYAKDGTNVDIQYFTTRDVTGEYIEVPLVSYIGYSATLNNDEALKVSLDESSLLRIYLDDSDGGSIQVKYMGFASWNIAFYCSVITLIAATLYSNKYTKKFFRKKSSKNS